MTRVFYEPLAWPSTRAPSSTRPAFVEAADQIVAEMHEDGTLTGFSEEWYDGLDLTGQQ